MRAIVLGLVFFSTCVTASATLLSEQEGATITKATENNGTLTLEISVNPSLSTPHQTPSDGELKVSFEKADSTNSWTTADPTACGWTFVGEGRAWTYKNKLKEAFTGRVCVQQIGAGGDVGRAVYREFRTKPQMVSIEDTAVPQNPPSQLGILQLTPNTSNTFYLRVRDVSSDAIQTTGNSYYLQINGPGSQNVSFADGTHAKRVTFVNGEATFTLTGRSGIQGAELLGFDADFTGHSPDALGPVCLPIVVGR